MYEHTLQSTPKWIEYFNYALLTWLTLFVMLSGQNQEATLVLTVFAIYTIGADKLGPLQRLGVWQVLTFGIGYLAVRRVYAPREIVRQVINTGWFVWVWCMIGFVMQLIGGYPLNAGSSIVFQPHVASVAFGMLLPFGLEIEDKRARWVYITLGVIVLCSVVWRSRVSAVIMVTLCAGYAWRRVRELKTSLRIAIISVFVIASIAGLCVLSSLRMSSVLMRFETWTKAITQWAESPLVGIGLGRTRIYSEIETYHDISTKIFRHGYTTVMLPGDFPRPLYAVGVHNAYLTTLLETGIIGFALLMLAIFTLWYSREYRPGSANLAMLALLASNLTGDSTHAWHVALLTVCCIATTNWRDFRLGEGLRWAIRRERIIGYGG